MEEKNNCEVQFRISKVNEDGSVSFFADKIKFKNYEEAETFLQNNVQLKGIYQIQKVFII